MMDGDVHAALGYAPQTAHCQKVGRESDAASLAGVLQVALLRQNRPRVVHYSENVETLSEILMSCKERFGKESSLRKIPSQHTI